MNTSGALKNSFGMIKVVLAVILISSLCLLATVKSVPAAENVHRGGTVTVVGAVPNRIIPGFMSSGVEGRFASMVYSYLFRLAPKTQKVQGSLVKEYEVSTNAKEWTMHLREGVYFHHGPELTADDVVYTARRWIDPDVGTAVQGVFKPLIDKIEKVDKYTVKFYLKHPDANFKLKLLDYNAAIISTDYDYESEAIPSGTGAFEIESYTPRQQANLVANDDYWIEGVPYIDNLIFKFVPERETRIRLIQAGQADIMMAPNLTEAKRLEKDPNVEIITQKCGHFPSITMQTDKPPFNDNRVRLAMKLVIDREEMLSTVMENWGSNLGNDTPFPPFHRYYNDLGGIRKRDVAKAKELLKEAGYENGLSVDLYGANNYPPMMDMMITYKQMAKDAGININIKGATRDVYLSKYWGNKKLFATFWGHREDVSQLLKLTYTCDGSWNVSNWCNKEFDKLVEKVSSETDQEKRKEYFFEIQRILHEKGPAVIPFFRGNFAAVSTSIEDFYLTRNWICDFRFIKVLDE